MESRLGRLPIQIPPSASGCSRRPHALPSSQWSNEFISSLNRFPSGFLLSLSRDRVLVRAIYASPVAWNVPGTIHIVINTWTDILVRVGKEGAVEENNG